MINKIFFVLVNLVLIFSSPLPQLTPSSMDGSYFLVQVSTTAPEECNLCKEQEKELIKAGLVLDGIVKVGKTNVNIVPNIRSLKLARNPSYVLFKGSLTNYVQVSGKPSRISFLKFVSQQIAKTIREKDNKLFSSERKPRNEKGQPKQRSKQKKDSSGVIVLNDADFQKRVLQSDEAWFVQFYSPSCGHCQALQPEWDKLPSKIGKRVNIAKIDATQNRGMSQKYQIKGFPTLFLFVGDKKSPVQYNNERTADAMIQWLNTQPIGEQKIEFEKLSIEKYEKECNRNIICLLFILDSKSELKSLDFIEEVMQQSKGKPLRFFYSRRLPVFEENLMIYDRSTPKLVSIWNSINSYKVYNGKMDKEQTSAYLTKIMERRSWIKMQQGKISSIVFKEQNQEL